MEMLKPDIDPKPRISYLEIATHRLVATNFMGDYQSVFKGRGVVFESYREYGATDDAMMIDWKTSLRAGKPMVKEFAEERNLDVFFLVDGSHTMVFGSQKKLKFEYAAELVASMAFSILERGDSVGLGIFNEDMRGFLMPERGITQYRRMLRVLADPENYDGGCNFEEAVRACVHRLRPETLLILVTDAVHLEGDWELLLKIANRKFEVLIILLRDPRDDELPDSGHVVVENPSTGQQLLIDTGAIQKDYARAAKEILEHNLATMRRGRVADIPIIMTNEDFPKHIISFFERRKRRMR
jgi:uncharacterized protein (DUF58 family)